MSPLLLLGGAGVAGLIAYLATKDSGGSPASGAAPATPTGPGPLPPLPPPQPRQQPQGQPRLIEEPMLRIPVPLPPGVIDGGELPDVVRPGIQATGVQEIPLGPSGLPGLVSPFDLPKLAPMPASLPAVSPQYPYQARVVTRDAGAAGALTVRSSASTTSPMVGGIAKDSIVTVFEGTTINGLGRARVSGPSFPSGGTATGWVNSQFLQRLSPAGVPEAPPGVMPAGFNPTFPTPGYNPMGSGGLSGVPIIPVSLKEIPIINAANAAAALLQPPFPLDPRTGLPSQPPLPPPPPQEALMPGKLAIVATDPSGTEARLGPNATSLRVRSAPNTTAPEVPGGNPADGGGFAKGQTVTITGPMQAGFSPVTGVGRKGNTLTGWSGAAFLK
jgi:hypothetical protein